MTTFNEAARIAQTGYSTENDIRRGQEVLRELVGETCSECRGIIATPQTASWVYTEKTICECCDCFTKHLKGVHGADAGFHTSRCNSRKEA